LLNPLKPCTIDTITIIVQMSTKVVTTVFLFEFVIIFNDIRKNLQR
jgi:hypothetical protein